MSFPTWPPDINNITDSVFKNTILDGQVDVSGTFYNRTGNVIIGDSANPDFDPSSNGITLNTTRICLGKDSSVTGDNGVAIGNSATTGLQENSISIGYNSIVDASNSVAIGPDASANGLNSIALGYNSGTGSYTNSIALGANSTVGANNVISLGDGTHKVGIGATTPTEALDVNGNIGLVGSGPKYIRGATDILTLESEYALKIKSDWNDNNSTNPADIIFYTGASERMIIKRVTGNVGIGTTSPDNKLTISGGAIQLNPFATGTKKFAIYSEGDKLHINPRTAAGGYDSKPGLIMNSSGYVGIGTTPTYPFHISDTVFGNGVNYSSTGFLGGDAAWNYTDSTHEIQGYIRRLGCQFVIFESDRRIKTEIVDIEDDAALITFRKLKPRNYKYIDFRQRGSNIVYGFIAQEVKEVLPNLTGLDSKIIPNIYELANIIDGVITLTNNTTIDLSLNDTIRLITETEDIETTVTEIIDDKKFKVEKPIENGNLFVYGKKIDDFHTLDKNAIFTVATAALQEVDRQLQAEKVKTATLESKVATLETQITDLLARVTALENP